MRTFSQFKKEVIDIFNRSIKFAKETGYDSISKTIENIHNEFTKKQLMVVVCGEMRRGKSSLLTAFLEEEGLFPIDINTCTNVISIVRYGETEKIEVILEKTEGEEIIYDRIHIKREDIDKYVTEYGNENNSRRVSCLNIEVPNEKLKEGFVFVDTPGVGSLNFEHAQVTYGFLPNADVLLFVSDVLNPLTDSELKFLEKSYAHCKNIVFPLTKSDEGTKESINAIINNNIKKISYTLKLEKEEINIIPVSNDEKLLYLKNKKEECLQNSNFKDLETLIWKTIYDNRTQILILPFLLSLLEEVQKIKGNINIQQETLEQDISKANELVKELKEKQKQQTKLKNESSKWQKDIHYKLNVLSHDVGVSVSEASFTISDNVEDLLNQQGSHNNVDEISNSVNEMLSVVVLDIKDDISTSVTEISNEILDNLGLYIDINESIINAIGFERKETIEYPRPEVSAFDKVVSEGRTIASKSFGGGMVGTIIGGTVGGLIGLLGGPVGVATGIFWGSGIGSLGAGAKGVYDALLDPNANDIPIIKRSFTKYINQSINKIQKGVNRCILELNKSLTDEFSRQLKNQITELNDLIRQIESSLTLTEKEVHQRKSTLQIQMKSVEKIEKETIILSDEITHRTKNSL